MPRASSSKREGGAVGGLHVLRLRAALGWQTQVQGLHRVDLAAWRVQVLVNVPHADVDFPAYGAQHLQWREEAAGCRAGEARAGRDSQEPSYRRLSQRVLQLLGGEGFHAGFRELLLRRDQWWFATASAQAGQLLPRCCEHHTAKYSQSVLARESIHTPVAGSR